MAGSVVLTLPIIIIFFATERLLTGGLTAEPKGIAVHDPLSVADLVHDELRQRIESGYDVSGIEADLATMPTDDLDRLEALYLELINDQAEIRLGVPGAGVPRGHS